MLALKPSSSSSERKATPHIVPFRINHTGPTAIAQHYWGPESASPNTDDNSDSKVSYFRGRKLLGRKIPVKDGYRGVVVKMSDQPATDALGSSQTADQEREGNDDGDDEPSEPTRAMEELASFDAVMVWGHEALPTDEEPAVRGLQEWIGLAEAMHDYEGRMS